MKTSSKILLISFILLLAACAGGPVTPVQETDTRQIPVQEEALAPKQQIKQWLDEAETSQAPQRQQLQIQAAQLLFDEQQHALAEELLEGPDWAYADRNTQVKRAILRARIHSYFSEYVLALSRLDNPGIHRALESAPVELQIEASRLRASLYAATGQAIAAAREHVYIDPLLDGAVAILNREALWSSLSKASRSSLNAAKSDAKGDWAGWLELALLARENQADLDAQLDALDQWVQRWSRHPAGRDLPGGLDVLRSMAANRPKQVALLLPVSGRLADYGKAIRDGFMASMLHTRSMGGKVPVLRQYDTASNTNIVTLYEKAVTDGADLVIGPLRKSAVQELNDAKPAFAVPVLALNRLETGSPAKRFYQFGLAPEDEAGQIASIAFSKGHETALILAPEGRWGSEVAGAFERNWQELGGSVVGSATFNARKKDFSSVIESLLRLKASKARARQLRQITGLRPEFSPRRRDDVDMIFMLARPGEARSIKPLLAFHYAGDLPVYASSQVYQGSSNRKRDRDINGVFFTDIPWLLDEKSPLRVKAQSAFPQYKNLQRMMALGVDSYRLHNRLPQLVELDSARVFGETGTLTLNDKGQIERRLMFAQFKSGRAAKVPIAERFTDTQTDGQQQ